QQPRGCGSCHLVSHSRPPSSAIVAGAQAPDFQLLLASSMPRQANTSLALTIREHDAALGGLIRANPLAILVVDAHDRVQMVNPAFEALFGFREAELVGHPIEAFIVPPDRAVEAAGLSQRGFDGQSARSVTQRRRKDGSVVDIDLTVVPLATGSETVGAYGIFRDLTEQKHAERQLRAQYAVVEALAN